MTVGTRTMSTSPAGRPGGCCWGCSPSRHPRAVMAIGPWSTHLLVSCLYSDFIPIFPAGKSLLPPRDLPGARLSEPSPVPWLVPSRAPAVGLSVGVDRAVLRDGIFSPGWLLPLLNHPWHCALPRADAQTNVALPSVLDQDERCSSP